MKYNTTLTDNVASDSFISKIEDAIHGYIVPQNNDILISIRSDLSQLSQEIRDYSQKLNDSNNSRLQTPSQPQQMESTVDEPTTEVTTEPPTKVLKNCFYPKKKLK